jgi:TPR repeat protein
MPKDDMRQHLLAIGAIAFAVLASGAGLAKTDAPITDCDKLAALNLPIGSGTLSVPSADLNADLAVPACRKAAEQYPDPRFRFQLGRALEKAGNMQLAIDQYQMAANDWFPFAIYAIGRLYANGKGLPKDPEKALLWYNKAAEHGQPDAQFELGRAYRRGDGFPKDAVRAVAWFQRGAQQGHAGAQYALGQMYNFGEGVAEDPRLAVYWYTQASNQGMPEAQGSLGYMWSNGLGTQQDRAYASRLFAAAAARGVRESQFNLASLYENGAGVEFDLEQAIYWYSKAAEQGDEDAAKKVTALKTTWPVLKSYIQASGKKYAVVTAVALGFIPGAVVCDNYDRVDLVYHLYADYWEKSTVDSMMGEDAKHQDRLLHGAQARPKAPNPRNYGCVLVDPGTKMYLEVGNMVPVVLFMTEAGSLFHGVTFEGMVQR